MRPVSTDEAGADLDIHMTPRVLSYNDAAAPQPMMIHATSGKCDANTCPWWPYSDSKDFKTNTALILIILLCALVCALAFNAAIRYILLQHRRRRMTTMQTITVEGGAQSEKSSSVEIQVIPTLIFSAGMKLAGTQAECTICLSEFVEGDAIQVLDKCDHGFHVNCIQKWLVTQSSCPTCRATCFPPFPSSPASSNGRLGNGAEV